MGIYTQIKFLTKLIYFFGATQKLKNVQSYKIKYHKHFKFKRTIKLKLLSGELLFYLLEIEKLIGEFNVRNENKFMISN